MGLKLKYRPEITPKSQKFDLSNKDILVKRKLEQFRT
jgi:hypothetical protein